LAEKDVHDYINIYVMLVLTAIIAYGAIYAIPHQIEESTSLNDWTKIYYKEALKWHNVNFIIDEDELLTECNALPESLTKTLEKNYAFCIEGKRLPIMIKKLEGECYQKVIGNC